MNPATVWRAGGAAIDIPQRRFMAWAWIVFTLFGLGMTALVTKPNVGWVVVLFPYAGGMVFWWAFVVSRAVLLQRDMRLLRIPETDRTIYASLGLQFVLSVFLPALLLAGMVQMDFPRASALLALCAVCALLFQLLPRFLGTLAGFLPMLCLSLSRQGVIPGLTAPAFPAFGWTLSFVFAAVVAWRWRVLLKASPDEFSPWTMPMVMQMRRQVGMAGGFKDFDMNLFYSAAKKSKADAQVCLDGVGPATPVTALRVWLGATFAPQMLRARLSQALLVLLPFLAGAVFMGISQASMRGGVIWAVMFGGAFYPLMLIGTASAVLNRFYKNPRGEIALLATLPGLGNAAFVKRNLLLASAGRIALPVLGVYAVIGLVALLYGESVYVLLGVVVFAAGAVALIFALALNFIGGRPLTGVEIVLLCVFGIIAMCTTSGLAVVHSSDRISTGLVEVVAICWLAAYALIGWLAWRGGSAFQRRPHPFLLNS